MSYDEHLISMAGGDGDVAERIASIQKSNDTWLQSSVADRNDHNTAFLLALVREQQAKLDAVTTILDEWASLKPFPDAEETQRWYSLGKRHAADRIRTAVAAEASA